jgi:phage gp29-like protein
MRSDVYAKAPITAASKSQQADNLMQMQGQFQFNPPIITPEEWIEMKDFPNKEDILARMQADRENKQNQDAQALKNQILQIIQQAQQIKSQGATDDQINQQVAPMVQQIVQATFTSGQNQGSADVMQNKSAPAGTMSPTAMGNMQAG